MSKIGWFLVGTAVGIVALAQYRDNPKVSEALDESRRALEEFASSVAEGYTQREAELKGRPSDETN